MHRPQQRLRAETRRVPLSWFGETLWRYAPLYVELIVIAFCLRLLGLVEPFVFQVVIDRVLPFQREATLAVVVAIFAAASLYQAAFQTLSAYLGWRRPRASRASSRGASSRICFDFPSSISAAGTWAKLWRAFPKPTRSARSWSAQRPVCCSIWSS